MKHLYRFNEAADRERIDLSQEKYLKYLLHENIKGYKSIDNIFVSFDGEKGYVEYDVIIQRESDGKFFKGHGEDWGRGESEVEPIFVEVYPQEKTITVYK